MRTIILKLTGPRGAWECFEESSPKSSNKEICEYANFLARKRLGRTAVVLRQHPMKAYFLLPVLVYRYIQLVQINVLTRNFPD